MLEIKKGTLSPAMLSRFSDVFVSERQNTLVQNAVTKMGIRDASFHHGARSEQNFVFSSEIKAGSVTNQKKSGRCWLFAGLNVIRVWMMEEYGLPSDFELSQTYLMFWDKLEKANYFLESIQNTFEEPQDGRLLSWLLESPMQDGGQWDMFVNLVDKYGLVPKSAMQETFSSSESAAMNQVLTAKLRQSAAVLRANNQDGVSEATIQQLKQTMLEDVYRILAICLGEPPKTFDFEYRDNGGEFHRDAAISPRLFFQKYVHRNLHDYISVINAPTADKPFGRTYTVSYLGNVSEGRPTLYLNVDMPTMKSLAKARVEALEPVWFGCDVGKFSDRQSGILDTSLYDYALTLGTSLSMSKRERLDFGESRMTHAMVLTGVHVVDGQVRRWKVENSWGAEPGNDGFFVMSDSWFEEYVYQIVVDRKHLPDALQTALDSEPIVLAPWDPMGSLA